MNKILVHGLILGAIGIFIELLLYMAGIDTYMSWWHTSTPNLRALLILGVAIYLAFEYRKFLGGFVSYGKILAYFLLILLIYNVAWLSFATVLTEVIDKEFGQEVADRSVELVVEAMEKFNAPKEVIQQSIDDMEANRGGMAFFAKGFAFLYGSWLVISLILAAIVKKNKPEFA